MTILNFSERFNIGRSDLTDDFLANHLQSWMDRSIPTEDQEKTGNAIVKFVNLHPEVLDRNSWRQIWDLASVFGFV